MLLSEARAILINSVLNSTGKSFSEEKQDRALMFALGYFAERTRCIRKVATHAIAGGGSTFTAEDDFWPQNLLRARIDWYPLTHVDMSVLMRLNRDYADKTDRPNTVAFEARSSGHLFPEADAAYTLRLFYWAPLTTWTPGTSTAQSSSSGGGTWTGNITLAIPDRWIREAIWLGAGTALVYGERRDNLWATTGWQMFEKLIREVRDKAADGGESFNPPTDNLDDGV